ncbi:hypothetical protein LCGC14_2977840, partial [marine sediment metagenome]
MSDLQEHPAVRKFIKELNCFDERLEITVECTNH